jgi:hypothetical protein
MQNSLSKKLLQMNAALSIHCMFHNAVSGKDVACYVSARAQPRQARLTLGCANRIAPED